MADFSTSRPKNYSYLNDDDDDENKRKRHKNMCCETKA